MNLLRDAGVHGGSGARRGSDAARRTASKIIEAAIALMVDHSSRHVEMSHVARAAGVSRTTLYRHFPTREALLEGIFEDTMAAHRVGMQAALAARPAVQDRIDVVAEFAELWLTEGRLPKMYRIDAALMLKLTDRIMPDAVELFLDAMLPVFEIAELLSGERLDRRTIAQMFVHYSTSMTLFPPPGAQDRPSRLMARLIRALLRMPADAGPVSA